MTQRLLFPPGEPEVRGIRRQASKQAGTVLLLLHNLSPSSSCKRWLLTQWIRRMGSGGCGGGRKGGKEGRQMKLQHQEGQGNSAVDLTCYDE